MNKENNRKDTEDIENVGNTTDTDEIDEAEEKKIFSDLAEEQDTQSADIDFDDVDYMADSEQVPDINDVIKFMDKRNRQLYILVHIFAFAIPFILMIIAFANVNIFPLGNATQQIMVIDSWHQYYPFLQTFQEKLVNILNGSASLSSILYSWNIGGGVNFLALMSYYASTPLYLLSALCPKEYLREFMMFSTIVKISCSGLFFSIYLRGIFKKCDFTVLGFSVLYALSAYAVGYYWCLMWLECMALLPLLILGLHNFIEKGKYRLYVIVLGLTVVCNYYIAFFVAVFVAIYYLVLYFSKKRSAEGEKVIYIFRNFVLKTLKVVAMSLVGVGLAGFILIPTVMSLQNTGNVTSMGMPKTISTYNTLLDIFTNLLTNTKPAIRAGLPNIACGLIAVIFALMFFINSKITLREKILNGAFFMFMAFSFNINILNELWQGLRKVNEIPYRQAFAFSFVFLTVAYKAFTELDNMRKKTIGALIIGILAYLIIAEQWYSGGSKFDFKVFYVNIILLAVYAAVIMLYKYNKMPIKYFSVILLFMMMLEGGISAINGARTTGTTSRESYPPAKEAVQMTVDKIYKSEQEKFFRLEMSRWYSTNDPAIYGYRGISQFSSMANSRFTKMMEVMGIAASVGSNRYMYSSATPVFNMMCSIKYLMTRDNTINSVAFDYITDNENITVYENKYWLPLGFMVSSDITEWDKNNTNIFLTQNDFMKTATGIQGNIFKSIYPASNSNENIDETRSEYGVYSYRSMNGTNKGTISHTYVSDKNQQMYIYLKASQAEDKKGTVKVNKGKLTTYEIDRGITIDCGYVKAGDEITVSFNVDTTYDGMFYIFVAGFDEELFKKGYDVLNSQTLQVTDFDEANIKGTITVDKYYDMLFTSIPYEKGWHAKVDGKKVTIQPLDNGKKIDKKDKKQADAMYEVPVEKEGAFVMIPLDEGTHEIEFYYITEGLVSGIVITIVCVFILLILFCIEVIFKNGRSKEKENINNPAIINSNATDTNNINSEV